MTADADYERSLYEVRMDICYYAKIHALHERLYARADKGLKLFELIAGSGAFYAVTAGHDVITQWCALLIAVAALFGLVFDLSGRARAMRDAVRMYMDLLAESNKKRVTVESVDEKLARVGRDAPTVIDGLRKPAYNQNVLSHGRGSYVLKLNRWERLLQVIA